MADTIGARRAARALLVAAVLVALVLFARTIRWTDTWTAISRTSAGVLALAICVNLASVFLKGARWWVFLRPAGIGSAGLAMRGTLVGAALNNILIASGGDAARVMYVARSTGTSSSRVLATLALERLFELVGYVVLLAAAVTSLQLPAALAGARPYAIASLLLVGVVLILLVRRPAEAGAAVLEGEGLLHRLRVYCRTFMRTLAELSTQRRFLAALGISVAVWALQVATYQLTAMAAGFDIPLVGTVAALLAVNLGFAVRATPGNVGVFQMMYAVTAAGFGMNQDAAIGVALLIQAQQIVPVTVLGLLAAPAMLSFTSRTQPSR